MNRRRGFTLIELLTVVAIIAILAAIIVPVFARARDSAYRAGDISQMNGIRSALQLYRLDQGGYPPALLGFVTQYTGSPNTIPANELRGFLYPKRIRSIDELKPAYNRFRALDTSTAVYPNQDPRAVGTAPLLDLTGDGVVNAADDTTGARQAFGPASGNVCRNGGVGAACGTSPVANFYLISGYDVARVPAPGGGSRTELRYALFWSNYAIGAGAGFGGGSAQDDPRQLGYSDPPDSTVITWNGHFRTLDSGVPARERRDLVLFLGGGARTIDSRDVFERSWRIVP